MPYTPPGPQSPAASKHTSPAASRSSSFSEEPPRSPSISRPAPPRSHSSASYLHKHRRSPSVTSSKSDGAPPTPTDPPQSGDFVPNGSVRQSPPPLNNLAMPTGAVLSPPDSPDSSDNERRSASPNRGRELGKTWSELQQAVRAIDQGRPGSPERSAASVSEPVSQVTSPSALTSEARRIAHSRSTTETSIVTRKTQPESSGQTTDDSADDDTLDDEDDDQSTRKPILVRKKSGELVKPALRPSSRRRYSSVPGTPTYSKSVHFNDSDNQTRHFLQVDKPIAVSAGSSPVETYDSEAEFPFDGDSARPERQIRLANFPADNFERRTRPVRVERIYLSDDQQTLIGVVAVQNLSFQKLVVARFTVDYWKTTSEVVAEFNNDPRQPSSDGCDRFHFHIKLFDQANIDHKTLLMCVRYNVGGQEFWDNNDNTNYQIDFTQTLRTRPAKPSVIVTGLGQRPLNAIPRSRHIHGASSPSRGHRESSADDDFAARLDASSAYHFGSTDQLLGDPNPIKLRSRNGKRVQMQSGSPPTAQPAANGLGGRYDFGASLSAALSSAQDKLGRQSGLMHAGSPAPQEGGAGSGGSGGGGYFGPMERKAGPAKTDERPGDLLMSPASDRPAIGSEQYRDLVQKFCYFTTSGPNTGAQKPATSPPEPEPTHTVTLGTKKLPPPSGADGADDSPFSSKPSSGTASPRYDGAGESRRQTAASASPWSTFTPRAGSPSPAAAAARSASPISFTYSYYDGAHSSCTQTAIQG